MKRGRPIQKKIPIAVAYKASEHGRSKPKVKVFKNKHIDDILFGKKIVGIPDHYIILEVGVGSGFEEKYKKKYKVT